jgi:hypothetical protein
MGTGTDRMAETTTRSATCSCGQLRVVVEGEPLRVSVCHCRACQRRTGSAFGVQARWPRDRARTEGETRIWRRIGDDGTALDFRFCPHCGSTVWFTQDVAPELIAVAVGAFGDPIFPAPAGSNYEECRHPWVGLPDEMERS